jgi:outer membrane biosynthesis protein TonB
MGNKQAKRKQQPSEEKEEKKEEKEEETKEEKNNNNNEDTTDRASVKRNGVETDRDGYAAKGSKWPDMVGQPASKAEAYFKEKYPRMEIMILPPGLMFDRQTDYGRIIFDKDTEGNVNSIPEVG